MPAADKPTTPVRHSLRQVTAAVWRMLRFGFRASPWALPAMLFFVALNSLLPFGVSFLDSRVIDEIVRLLGLPTESRVLDTLIPLIALVIAARIIERLAWVFNSYADRVNYFSVSRAMTLAVVRKASELDIAHYEDPVSSSTIQKARDAYEWKPSVVIDRALYISGDVIRLITSMTVILSFSFPAFLLVLATTLPALIAHLKLGRGSWSIWETNTTDRRRFSHSVEHLNDEHALMELRIFRTRRYLLEVVEGIYDRFIGKERKDALRRTLIQSVVGNFSTVGAMIFWVIAIAATLNGQITIGLLTFYTGALQHFSDSLGNLFRNLGSQYEDGLYLVDLFAYFDLPTLVKSGAQPTPGAGGPPRIVFQDVTFIYPNTEKPVLKDFNLVIEPGAHIALVGVNGAGKSTLIKLLCRFYDVTSGQILINGVDLRDLDFESWYRQIGVLFQDFIQYGQFSARTNIELGDIDGIGDAARLEQALFKADAESFLRAYTQGLETVLDKSFEGGMNPSVGQWQRIALARAFFRDAPVLVLDEPTSAIDALAEYEIFERLYAFSADKTLIVISHRFSTVRNADLIYVIDDGQIVESGSHEALLALNGQYAKAFEAQAQGYR